MELTVKHCLCCGREIVKDQFCTETPDQFAKRHNESLCRAKCRRLHKPLPSPKDHIASTGRMVVDPTVWNLSRPEGKEQPKEKPVRDKARLAYARSMPCTVCGSIEGTHAHHEQLNGGIMGGKVSDRSTLPLCWKCHMLRHDKGREVYGDMDVEKVIERINAAYDERKTQPSR